MKKREFSAKTKKQDDADSSGDALTAKNHARADRTVTRADILDSISRVCPTLSRSQARAMFEMTLEEIIDSFNRNESIKLRSFGSFTVRSKRARIGRNPKTGVEAQIVPRRVVTFKPSPVLIARVNGQSTVGLEDKE